MLGHSCCYMPLQGGVHCRTCLICGNTHKLSQAVSETKICIFVPRELEGQDWAARVLEHCEYDCVCGVQCQGGVSAALPLASQCPMGLIEHHRDLTRNRARLHMTNKHQDLMVVHGHHMG